MIKYRKSGRYLILLVGLGSSLAFSSKQPNSLLRSSVFHLNQYKPLITLTVGPDFVQAGQAQTLTLLPPFQNHYTNNNATATVVDGGGFIGVERRFTDSISLQFGVAGYGDGGLTVRGDVWQFAVPLFDTLAYSYQVHHARVMLSSKLLATFPQYKAFHPYFSWELGAAYNRASSYQEQPLIPLAYPMTPFANNTKNSFSWGVGLGFDYNLSQHLRAGIGYQFADLGSVALGLTPAESTSQTVGLAHLYTNQLRFQFSFLA